MGQVFFQDNVAPLVKASSTQITMAATNAGLPTCLTIGGQQYILSGTLTLTPASVGFNGLDTGSFQINTTYNIFATLSNGIVGLVCTTGLTPTGYTQYKFLAKFNSGSGENVSHVMNIGEPFVEYVSGLANWDTDDTTSGQGINGTTIGGALTTTRTKLLTWIRAWDPRDVVAFEIKASTTLDVWMTIAQYAPYILDSTGSNALSAGAFFSNAGANTITLQFARYRGIANDDSPQFDWILNTRYRVSKTSLPVRTP